QAMGCGPGSRSPSNPSCSQLLIARLRRNNACTRPSNAAAGLRAARNRSSFIPPGQAWTLAVKVVVPVMDQFGTIFNVDFVTATAAPRRNARRPSQIMLLAAAYPEQYFLVLALRGVGGKSDGNHDGSAFHRPEHEIRRVYLHFGLHFG